MTFAVGFAYMESEKTDNYHWALDIFPHTTNMLCTWHIIKNVNARCTVQIPKDMKQKVKNLWRDVVESPDEVEYQQRLNAFQQACVNSSNFVEYVNNTWLAPHKEQFVEAWTNRVMHLGNTTTNRVESAHWRLKKMLEHSKGDLCKCLEGMNDNIRLEVDKIKKSFQKSFYYTEKTHSSPFFQYLRNFVSRAAMTLISDEMERIGIVGTNKNLCGCKLRSTSVYRYR
ncbi:uncharacterized protein LOC123895974 [Trifolium pratense]|uniref:uncharacterized protein LOC123895974 n=1 Tax=Trifolium pratense TaxID=57577 RepID=UPI001E691F1C|nr:uncharacterized protein LOC123895974 [Trifolium pratense]